MSRTDVVKRLALTALLMALLAIAGCGEDSTPTSSEVTVQLTDAGSAPAIFSFGSGAEPAAKSMGGRHDEDDDGEDDDGEDDDGDDENLSDSDEIGPKGGKLKVKDDPKRAPDGSRAKAKLEVEFKVPQGALDHEEEITMTVTGFYLSDLQIAFTPTGLVFARDAWLKIKLQRDRVDLDPGTIFGVHASEAGTQRVLVEVDEVKKNGDVTLNVRVPGFSRYSLGE